VRNQPVVDRAGIDDATFDRTRERELAELHRRTAVYRAGTAGVPVRGRPVVLVDDGLATGATMRAAVAALRRQHPARVTVAVPVAAPEVCAELAAAVDRVVCLWAPESFTAVGQGYADFTQTSDGDVQAALAGSPPGGGAPGTGLADGGGG
jgi:predicted phosphoribosyltransferase